jgi:hypothetical protein
MKVNKVRGSTQYFQPDFPRLHDIARHIIHSNETLDVAVDTIDSISHQNILFSEEICITSKQLQQRLYLVLKKMNAIKRRSVSLSERLQNEINLASNLIVPKQSSHLSVYKPSISSRSEIARRRCR